MKLYLAAFFAYPLLAFTASAQCHMSLTPNNVQSTAQSQDTSELTEAEQLNAQARALYKDHRFDKALPLAERALAIRERALGPDHPLVTSILRNIAEIQFAKGQRKEALATYERLVAAAERARGGDSSTLVEALDGYVCLLVLSGQGPNTLVEAQKRLYKLENGFDYDESQSKVGAARLAGAGLMIGQLIGSRAAEYPPEAKAKGITGQVVMKVTVDEAGNVVAVNVLCGNPILAKASEKSERKAKYRPTLAAGKPARVTGIAIYRYVLQ